jgi:hypothetical protein
VAERRGAEGAGVVHQRVEPAEMRFGGGDQVGQGGGIGQLGLEHQRAEGPRGLEFGHQRGHFLAGMAVVQGQVVTGGVQAAGNGGADALGGAGDQGGGTFGGHWAGLRAFAGILRAGT